MCHELPDGRVLLVDRQIHDNIPSHLGGIATNKTLLMKTETTSIASKEADALATSLARNLKGKNASVVKHLLTSGTDGRHIIEDRLKNIVLQDEQVIEKYAHRYGMDAIRRTKLLAQMQNDEGLALLVRSNPEFNILRWNNTLKKADHAAISKYALNTQYAGKPFYFHPSLNRDIQNHIAQKGTFSGYTREMLLELDKLFPDGITYTKEGFPDFIKANACKLDNNGEVIKVLMPNGHFSITREQDFAIARMVANEKYGRINEFGYIWHHLEGEPAAMVLVKTECHEICRHTDGFILERMHIENAARRLMNPVSSVNVKVPYRPAIVSGKETTQKNIGKGAKEVSETVIKMGVKKGTSQALHESAEKGARELAQEGVERGAREFAQEGAENLAGKTLKELATSNKVYNNLYDDFATKISKEFADGITTISTKDGIELMSKDFPVSKIYINKNLVVGNAGSLKNAGPVNEFLNHLIPNKTYMIDNGLFVYKTDDLGRVVECHAKRNKAYKSIERNTQRNSDVQRHVVEYLDGRKGLDDAGHLFANTTGGPNELINQVPMASELNRTGLWRELERVEEEALKEGKEVISSRKLIYKGNSKRPSAIEFITKIDGVETKTLVENI